MTADYKQLAEELYETLKQVRNLIDDANGNPISRWDKTMPRVDAAIEYYEEATTRGTGRTTALYIKCIAEALENPGKSVEFIDHYPHKWGSAQYHADRLEMIIKKLGYDIAVSTKGQAQVYLYNMFGQ
jgi:hypothetical protein